MTPAEARAFLTPIVRAFRALDASTADALSLDPGPNGNEYRRAAGRVMAEIAWQLLNPILQEHPGLEAFVFDDGVNPALLPQRPSLASTPAYVHSCLQEADALLAAPDPTDDLVRCRFGIQAAAAATDFLTDSLIPFQVPGA